MLKIKRNVLLQIKGVFQNKKQEQGFLLGCDSCMDQLNYCCQIPAVHAGVYFYKPDAKRADDAVKQWAKHNICFCGFIHSHLVEKSNLSEGDIDFAKALLEVYELPVLWFGIGVTVSGKVAFIFYQITKNADGNIEVRQTNFVCIE